MRRPQGRGADLGVAMAVSRAIDQSGSRGLDVHGVRKAIEGRLFEPIALRTAYRWLRCCEAVDDLEIIEVKPRTRVRAIRATQSRRVSDASCTHGEALAGKPGATRDGSSPSKVVRAEGRGHPTSVRKGAGR